MLTYTQKFSYNKEQELKFVYIQNKQEKIIPLYNSNNRLIPFPVKFIKSFVVKKPFRGKFGRIYFSYFNAVKDYSLLSNLLNDAPLHYIYHDTDELSAFLKEWDMYLYKEAANIDELDAAQFPLFTKINAKFADCVQQGRCVYRLRLIKNFFQK